MEFKREEDPKVRFTVPDRPTTRQQLRYIDATVGGGNLTFAWWMGARPLIEEWDCDLIPALDEFDIDKETNPKVTDLIVWVGRHVKDHMGGLEEVPKNS